MEASAIPGVSVAASANLNKSTTHFEDEGVAELAELMFQVVSKFRIPQLESRSSALEAAISA